MSSVSSENRWRQLLSVVGVAIALSSVAGHLTGYLNFLGEISRAYGEGLAGLYGLLASDPPSPALITMAKVSAVTVIEWIVMFFGLLSYSRVYHGTPLRDWLYWDVVFLAVPKDESAAAVRSASICIFFVLPFSALAGLFSGPVHRSQYFHCCGIHIRLWSFLWEAAFMNGILLCGLMVLHLGVRAISG